MDQVLIDLFACFSFLQTGIRAPCDQWAQTEKINKTAIQEQKIKCAFLPAEDGSTGVNGIPEENEDAHGGETSRLEESVSSPLFTDYGWMATFLASCRMVHVSFDRYCPFFCLQMNKSRDGLSRWSIAPDKFYHLRLRNGGFAYYVLEPPTYTSRLCLSCTP